MTPLRGAQALCLLIVSLAGLGAQAQAQAQDSKGPVDFGAQRQALQIERSQALAEFESQSRACQSRFAVTDCQMAVQARRRIVDSQYRRQEALINEEERLQRVEAQRSLTAEKQQERASREAASAEGATGATTEREQAQREKQHAQQRKLESAAARSRAAAEDKSAGGLSEAQQAANRTAYEKKMEDARQRQQRAQTEREKKSGSKPAMPVPP